MSPNLNCLIGGRGSGKSTALLAVRAALRATVAGEDADAEERMPDRTMVEFIDNAGSLRTAIRARGQAPVDADGSPLRLRLADLGQDESGRLARGYADDPMPLLKFLDAFVVRHEYDEAERELLAQLTDNAAEVRRTSVLQKQIDELTAERDRLSASLKAAQESRVEDIARWAVLLASQGPLLEDIRNRLTLSSGAQLELETIDLDALAQAYGVDLAAAPAAKFIDGENGLRTRLETFQQAAAKIAEGARNSLSATAQHVDSVLEAWEAEHANLQARLATRRTELEAQGLKVQADAISAYAGRLEEVKSQLAALKEQQVLHRKALKERERLLTELLHNREKLYLSREATLQRIAAQANRYSDDLTIRVFFEHDGLNEPWIDWLTGCGFNRPRVERLATAITPQDFAAARMSNPSALLQIIDPANGQPFFAEPPSRPNTWDDVFAMQTMRLEDRPRIEVQRRGESEPHPLDRLSAGQQRSVLLSLLLCAERSEPLILDQPEDHLDGQYIAGAVVRHLEAAKEHRQVLIATHSANLVVLGDAELVIPMKAEAGHGAPHAPGAIDNPQTRDQICSLLEGGLTAFRKRGQRYGIRFAE